MKADQSRSDLLMGVALITAGAVLSHLTGWPAWLFGAPILAGVVLSGEAMTTMRNEQVCLRRERRYQADSKMPKPQTITITQEVPRNMRNLVYDWFEKKPTTKEYAIKTHGVTQRQWEQAVQWAVGYGLGELVPAEGGSKKLRWTAATLNDFLPVIDGLAQSA